MDLSRLDLDVREPLRRAGSGAALSHELAAVAWGLELVDPATPRLTVPRNRSRLAVPGWLVRCSTRCRGRPWRA